MPGFMTSVPAALLVGSALCLSTATASAAPCDGSSDPCSVDLGRAMVSFAYGAASYFAEATITMGTDASVNANPSFLPLTLTHQAGSENFIIQPQIYTYVGGSGIQGLHEVVATLSFTGVSFVAEAGYQITSVAAIVKGSYYRVGDAYGGVNIPAALQWSGDNYTATLALDPTVADLSIGFSLAASYLQGDDGTALSYGAGSASIDSLEFIVGVSPVPEPATAALLALGGALLPWVARRRLRMNQ